MASIQRRGKKYCVVYRYQDEEGNVHQKWETFDNQKDADKRKKEVDYKIALLMKVLENPEMAALLTSLAKTMKV